MDNSFKPLRLKILPDKEAKETSESKSLILSYFSKILE